MLVTRRTSTLHCLGDLGDGGREDCTKKAQGILLGLWNGSRMPKAGPSAKHSVKDGKRASGYGMGAAGPSVLSQAVAGI